MEKKTRYEVQIIRLLRTTLNMTKNTKQIQTQRATSKITFVKQIKICASNKKTKWIRVE